MRMSSLVNVLLAFALAATVLAAALLVGLFPGGGGGTAVATTRPPQASGPLITSPPVATPSPTASPSPIPTEDVPSIPPGGTTYEVQPGDALSLIGERFGIPWLLIAQANNIPPPDYIIAPGQVLIIPALAEPSAGADFYIVQTGDTMTSIAQAVGIEPTVLADYNNVVDWNLLQVGQVLYIPADENATPLPLETP